MDNQKKVSDNDYITCHKDCADLTLKNACTWMKLFCHYIVLSYRCKASLL